MSPRGTPLAQTHPALAREWHPERNGDLTPETVSAGSDRMIWWRCACDPRHEWQARPGNRSRGGTRCPYCAAGTTRVDDAGALSGRFPEVAAEWDAEANPGRTPEQTPPGSRYRAGWKCVARGHRWRASVYSRAQMGRGCPACAHTVVTPGTSLLAVRPDLAAQWHPTRNGEIGPGDVGPESQIPAWFLCDTCQTEWKRAPASVEPGNTGCPGCRGFVVTDRNSLQARHPDIALEWNAELNAPLTPETVTIGQKGKVWWECGKCGFEWPSTVVVRRRLFPGGCPSCAGRQHLVRRYEEEARQHRAQLGQLTRQPKRRGPAAPSDAAGGAP